ncbi:Cmx/CmrA family chloramphenicol efflux MFS transporter [Streptomyces sp. NBC_01306]|uniref:Cmx/CmrA family chloramphenicol efflux MFS transporter n=1 Tax=Streptomyces sp. NBC_01306 TaxID=2903819 RepID=UPI0022560841|nr:Cmx/CmrA family chloramphenicol efflux MFS transporter [Streptomyces sp. NBC_01306]MCX4724603.1 MFS transporter [Streptomyces sp. NBC_01306]
MPFAVYVLGLAVFAQGTSEFMLSGLISGIATDLNVSLAAAGLLTSAFAVGMVVGAPLMALFARTWPRRRALLLFLAVFVAVHVIGALTPSYGVLLATRFAGAVANAGFWAVALTTAVSLVPAQLKARAAAVVVGGVTVACVVGVPAGAVLGERWGWRSAFWAVALVCVPAVLALVRNVPAGRPDAETAPVPVPVPVRTELGVLSRSRLRLTLLTMALVQGATFCTFSYLEPLLTRETGLSAGWVPAALALFGVGSFIGVTVAGRFADRRPTALIASGMVALALGWSALALTAGSPPAALALILVQGMFAFGTGTALIARVLDEAPEAPSLAGAFSTTAFNLGATLGPWAGGLALDAGFGYRAPVWVSGALMGLALITAGARRVRIRATG